MTYRVLVTSSAIGLALTTWLAAEKSPLPTWNGTERADLLATGWLPGSFLLTDEGIPGEPPAENVKPLEIELPRPDEVDDDSLVIPQVPEQFLDAYFAETPKEFLIDPQGLLSAADFHNRLNFLKNHASESKIDIYVYLLGGNQEIPSSVRKEELIERLFTSERAAVVVYFFMGNLARTTLQLNSVIASDVSVAEQHRSLESSCLQALDKSKSEAQLEQFLSQLSIHTYWMERMLKETPTAETNQPPIHSKPISVTQSSKKLEKLLEFKAVAQQLMLPAGVAFAVISFLLGLCALLRSRARHRLPEFEVEPRLGGAHAAGVGAVISFASAAIPPASQRNQMPDYLRRA